MATLDADNYLDPMPANPGVGVRLTREFEYLVATALALNDIIRLARLGRGLAIVLDEWWIDVPDLDTGTAILLQVGDNNTAAKFLAANTVGQAGGKVSSIVDGLATSIPVSYLAGADDDFRITVSTGPTTGTTGVTIRGYIGYHYSGITPLV